MDKLNLGIDEGHGGGDTGACANGLIERDLNSMVGRELERSLSGYCRTQPLRFGNENPKFHERALRSIACDWVMSIHHNALSRAEVSGVEIYVLPDASKVEREVSRRIIEAFPSELRSSTSRVVEAWDDPQIIGDEWKQAPFNVLRRHKCKKLLVEVCYLTNPGDASVIGSVWGRMAVASALRAGVAHMVRDYEARCGG